MFAEVYERLIPTIPTITTTNNNNNDDTNNGSTMSRCSWRSAEALHERRRARRAIQRTDEIARLRRERSKEEWHITGEPAFSPKERNYPHGGGVDGAICEGFLSSAERAIHLHDRYEKKRLPNEWVAVLNRPAAGHY